MKGLSIWTATAAAVFNQDGSVDPRAVDVLKEVRNRIRNESR
jgi:hypothetical protein